MNQGTAVQSPTLYDFEIEGDVGIYLINWPELHIRARVDRIKESTDHEVKAEVKIDSARPTSSGHLRAGRLNLTSPSARNSFGKSLAARDSEVDWDKVMEQLSLSVLDQWRRGSPVIELRGDVDVKALDKWLVQPIIQIQNPTLIYGPGSTGKSWFAQYLAVLCDEGMNHGNLSVEPATVLYLDWETDQKEIGSRVTMIRKGLSLEGSSHIWYRAMNQGLANDIEAIRAICRDKDIHLVIVDSLGSACMGEPESAEVVLRAFGALRSLGLSSLVVDHTNKEGQLFGSVYKRNSARQMFEFQKDQQIDEQKLVLGLFHKKANNGPLIKPLGYELTFSDSAVQFKRRDVRDTPLAEHLNIKDRIANILREQAGGLSVTDIAEDLEKTESHIRKELSEGKDRGLFVKLPNNNWANRARDGEVEPSLEQEPSWKL